MRVVLLKLEFRVNLWSAQVIKVSVFRSRYSLFYPYEFSYDHILFYLFYWIRCLFSLRGFMKFLELFEFDNGFLFYWKFVLDILQFFAFGVFLSVASVELRIFCWIVEIVCFFKGERFNTYQTLYSNFSNGALTLSFGQDLLLLRLCAEHIKMFVKLPFSPLLDTQFLIYKFACYQS